MQPIFRKIYYLCNKIKRFIDKRVEDFGAQYIAFGIFGFINYPASYFMWHNINTQAYESLPLRLVASFLCIPLALKSYWPNSLRTYLPVWWYFTILYSLPFFGTFMLLKNHASTNWLMNAVIGLFLLVLIVDWISFAILMAIGMPIAWLVFNITTNEPFYMASGNLSLALYLYLFAIIIGGIFSHNSQKLQKEKINAMAAVGGSIAHELRNPLLAINTMSNGIRKNFPKLLTGYQKADAHNLLKQEEKVRPDRFEALLTSVDDISAETQYANTMIDMLLLKVNPHIKSAETTICSIFDCIDDAVRRYPYNSLEQAGLIEWNMEKDVDFNFKGSQLLIVHILFNLIKNALFFIADAGKGHVYIYTELGESYNKVYFKDTAKGIPRHMIPRLFTRFFSKTQNGTGLGLAFCKMVMTGMGGDITCRSQEGEYTEFMLEFPRVHQKKVMPDNSIEA